jgi:hypothetical protein
MCSLKFAPVPIFSVLFLPATKHRPMECTPDHYLIKPGVNVERSRPGVDNDNSIPFPISSSKKLTGIGQ